MVTEIDRSRRPKKGEWSMVKQTPLPDRRNDTFVGEGALLRFLIGNFFGGRVFLIDYHNKKANERKKWSSEKKLHSENIKYIYLPRNIFINTIIIGKYN